MENIKESWLIAPISENHSVKEVVIRRDGLLKCASRRAETKIRAFNKMIVLRG